MSEIKTNKISPRKGTTQTIGDSGDTVTIASGTTLSNTGTVSGIGKINWDTTAKTSAFTAVNEVGYFVDTTSAAITVTFPASPSAGNVIGIKDYANTFDTNNLTIDPNGNKIQGSTNNFIVSVEGTAANFIYVDATRGWVLTDASKASDISEDIRFIEATGGTVLTCGNFKTHIFTSPGTFCVSSVGNPAGSDTVDYMVVAGGGGGKGGSQGSAGAGGFRLAVTTTPQSNPLNGSALPVSVTGYPITIGGGGTGANFSVTDGSPSIFSTITSAGGGKGEGPAGGGSGGGGGGGGDTGDPGNQPPVSPPQGNPGGNGSPVQNVPQGGSTGGGGGAGAAGGNGTTSAAGAGGAGSYLPDAFIGPTSPSYGEAGPVSDTRYFAGGGGGGTYLSATGGAGGVGGGGDGGTSNQPTATPGSAGSTNMGGGGGGGGHSGSAYTPGGNGGSGIVMIRYKYQ